MNWKALALIGVSAGLIGASNLWLYSVPVDITPMAPDRGLAQAEATMGIGSPAASFEFSDIAETFERPLFNPDRKRHQQAAVEPLVKEAPPPTDGKPAEVVQPAPALIGVSIGEQQASALLKFEGQDQPQWLRVGDRAGGWVVSDIGKDQAVLEQDGQTSKLMLYPSGRNLLVPGGAGVAN